MDKKESIGFLKEKIKEINHLAELPSNNLEYPVWHDTIAGVLEEVFGRDSSEYEHFSSKHKQGNLTTRSFYLVRLRKRYVDLMSIIQKYEILWMEGKRDKGGEVEKMDKREAIGLLRQELDKASYLKEQKYDNQEFESWRYIVGDIIKAALDSEDHNRFSTAAGPSTKLSSTTPDSIQQEAYQRKLTKYETALKSIIQKYEILGIETEKPIKVSPEAILREVPPKAFISHGKESAALRKLKEFVETLGVEPVIVKKLASVDKDLPDKVNTYLNQADFVIILATADDKVGDKLQPRQNVIHEIGLAQKTHPGRIIYLLEEGAEFPSNIRPKVWESFKQRNMMDAFLGIIRELRAYGILKVTKFPIEEQKS